MEDADVKFDILSSKNMAFISLITLSLSRLFNELDFQQKKKKKSKFF
ncbi:hypothetical protein Hanom_Chr13g01208001 [Helianthus anomalus]